MTTITMGVTMGTGVVTPPPGNYVQPPFVGDISLALPAGTWTPYPGDPTPPTPIPWPHTWMSGVNIAGADFGALGSNPEGAGGTSVYGWPQDYELDYFIGKGFRWFRVPFLAYHLVDYGNYHIVKGYDGDTLEHVIQHCAASGVWVLLDWHMYGGDAEGFMAMEPSNPEQVARYAEGWSNIAKRYRSYTNVAFGLQNEPVEPTGPELGWGHNAAIRAIRNAGCGHPITVSGTGFSGAWSWVDYGNGIAFVNGIIDPCNNYVFEAHQYLDNNNSGSPPNAPVVVGKGATALVAVTNFARAHGQKFMLGEFGLDYNQPQAFIEIDAMMNYMSTNRDVWMGFTYWAAGRLWSGYPFNCQPNVNNPAGDAQQMPTLLTYIT